MSDFWDRLCTVGIKVEVINRDTGSIDTKSSNNNKLSSNTANTNANYKPKSTNSISLNSASKNHSSKNITTNKNNETLQPTDTKSTTNQLGQGEAYWIGTVIQVYGYIAKIRYEGYEDDCSSDFWIHLFSPDVHGVGWCASQGKTLVPPNKILGKMPHWTTYLIKRLTGSRTLPTNFQELIQLSLSSRFRQGMKLEVVDKNRVSSVRVATVESTIGGRLLVSYDGAEPEHAGFWTHERSPLVHPVGWAQFVNHELVATYDYAKTSLEKVNTKRFGLDDATWDMFDLPSTDTPSGFKFEANMKLEALDPLNLSSICVATVIKVLRANYLMIGIDGSMCPSGSDWFCYHATSPYIFPTGYCQANKIRLSNPKNDDYFDWDEYLYETQSKAAPTKLFQRVVPNHGFEEGMMIEAVDLMQSRLVCVATITKIVGRLLRIHFNGWDETFDQWCDCESPDLFPLGWCKLVGYPLEPPKSADQIEPTTSSLQPTPVPGASLKRRRPASSQRRPAKRKMIATTNNNSKI